jgi:hypothetical protein
VVPRRARPSAKQSRKGSARRKVEASWATSATARRTVLTTFVRAEGHRSAISRRCGALLAPAVRRLNAPGKLARTRQRRGAPGDALLW